MSVGKRVSSTLKKIMKPKVIIDDKAGRAWHNLYTGKKMNPVNVPLYGAGVAIGGAAAGLGWYKKEIGTSHMKKGAEFDVGYVGKPDILEADGVGSNGAPRNLNATGDIVLGLHNGRRR